MYQECDLAGRGFGEAPVSVITGHKLVLKDGVQISCRIWFPSKSVLELPDFKGAESWLYKDGADQKSDGKNLASMPSILEYLPYRHGDYTAPRDHLRHPWLASHGYVVVRADMRGSGDSTGLMRDEYEAREQEDACQIIKWISQRSWSNGNVGMYGKSWGGFNGLQVAFCQPESLKAVISLYSTDNRFSDDIHWKGGCVLGNGMLSWASTMFAWKAEPPNPSSMEDWKEEWRRRLEQSGQSWLKTWLENQSYNSYWKHGSICEDYSRLKIPVLAIGGWHDGYTNAVFRLVDRLPNSRGIVGPWSHEWPDVAEPGPQIGYMSECLDFWDHHLRGQKSRKQQEAKKLIWYQCDGLIPPTPSIKEWPGRWLQSDQPYPYKGKEFFLDGDSLTEERPDDPSTFWKIDFRCSRAVR